jgi:hypothetical protein
MALALPPDPLELVRFYEAARRALGEYRTPYGSTILCDPLLGVVDHSIRRLYDLGLRLAFAELALEDAVRDNGPVTTERGIYVIGPEDHLVYRRTDPFEGTTEHAPTT